MHKSERCDNRDKLDDNAIPISGVNEERTEIERERRVKGRLLIKKGRGGGEAGERGIYASTCGRYNRTVIS